eukprot:168655-Chlamydomonas_euryale.AAC.4
MAWGGVEITTRCASTAVLTAAARAVRFVETFGASAALGETVARERSRARTLRFVQIRFR